METGITTVIICEQWHPILMDLSYQIASCNPWLVSLQGTLQEKNETPVLSWISFVYIGNYIYILL
jgi:hypothetical protein